MSQKNVQNIQAFYAALSRGDVEVAFTYLDPAFVLHQADSLPYGGTYQGHEAVKAFFEIFNRIWEQFQSVEVDYLAIGDEVFVRSRIRGRVRQTGREVEMPMVQIFHMQEGKAIAAYPFYWDTATLLEALM